MKFSSKKPSKCPFCKKTYVVKQGLVEHIEHSHADQIHDNTTASQLLFNLKYKKSGGKCVICAKPTKWNEETGRYERFDRAECKDTYVKNFQAKMIEKYGSTHLLNNIDQQKKMLANRSISGVYKFTDGTEFTYTGSYELDFLEYLDKVMHFDSLDIASPSPNVYSYKDEDGKERKYIPDLFIFSLNLEVEIKASDNMHYRQRDIGLEKLKANAVLKEKRRFIQVFDKKYHEFEMYLQKLKSK